MSWHVGIDTGGTFTDLAARDPTTGHEYVTKIPSTPRDPAGAIVGALRRFTSEVGASPGSIAFFAHGTTVATNAVLEGTGVRAGLLLTRGFDAIYEVRGGIRPSRVELIDPRYQKPRPLIPLALTRYVSERIGFDGTVLEPLDEDAARSAIRELLAEHVEAIAVLCLFSFMNSAHEERLAELVREEAPECRVSLSSRVLPVIREYPRLSTTALDAYVGPVIARYLEDLERRLAEEGLTTKQSYVMQSNGGLLRFGLASEHPNEILLSGPASGVAFALKLGAQIGQRDLVALDMGGTSTDISIVQDGAVAQTREGRIAGQEIGTPMTEIHTLGAGGGTIAWLGTDGLLKVGPQSAGADPGPACYGRGGVDPTVKIVSACLGLGFDRIAVRTGDTDDVPTGVGSFASRTAQAAGNAVYQAALALVARATELAANARGERVAVERPPVADQAPAWPSGAVLASVEVDCETGRVDVRSLVTCDDVGRVLNSSIVAGQLHGGLAFGIAHALLEEFVYDEDGVPLTTTFADYPAITADRTPPYEVHHLTTLAPGNALGAKGAGEAGSVGAPAAILNAVVDALSHLGVRHLSPPATPEKVVRTIADARRHVR